MIILWKISNITFRVYLISTFDLDVGTYFSLSHVLEILARFTSSIYVKIKRFGDQKLLWNSNKYVVEQCLTLLSIFLISFVSFYHTEKSLKYHSSIMNETKIPSFHLWASEYPLFTYMDLYYPFT